MKITVEGIELELSRKRIKNINLSVHPDGRVSVSAPCNVSLERIEAFVASKADWIRTHLEDVPPNSPDSCFLDGDTVKLFAKSYVIRLDSSLPRGSAEISSDAIVIGASAEDPPGLRERAVDELLRRELSLEIEYLLPIWEERTGLASSSWGIRKMKTRWGSCNTQKRSITFALELAKKDQGCIEYVILHELAHLCEANHGERFKAILDEYMPDWREIKQRLNRGESKG